jgi:hypothetical protein
MLFAGAAAVTACSTSTTPPTPPKDAEVDMGNPVALYGVMVRDAGEPDDDAGRVIEGGGAPLYGVAVHDASLEHDAGA